MIIRTSDIRLYLIAISLILMWMIKIISYYPVKDMDMVWVSASGAINLSRQGKDFTYILAHYYPGTKILRYYD